jgi:CDP-diacylglycerol--glycerol-3-phosphate 3-phosphatidyltransferase
MGIYSTKSKWQQALKPVVNFCVSHRIHPDVFTYGALILSLVAGWAFFSAGANLLWLWLAIPCLLLRLLFNLMDGLLARETGLADAFGEVKNEFGDRIADVSIFMGLAFGGYADARLAGFALALILCGSYLGILGKALGGPRVYGGVFGKGDRMISLALFSLYVVFSGNLSHYDFYLGFAILAAGVTIFQRLRSIYGITKSAR